MQGFDAIAWPQKRVGGSEGKQWSCRQTGMAEWVDTERECNPKMHFVGGWEHQYSWPSAPHSGSKKLLPEVRIQYEASYRFLAVCVAEICKAKSSTANRNISYDWSACTSFSFSQRISSWPFSSIFWNKNANADDTWGGSVKLFSLPFVNVLW